jgi:arylsulfatase A-like enzyme
MIHTLDANIGRLLDGIENLGLSEKTILIFTSDNGGLSTSEGSPTSNLPLRAGKGWLYEGGIREPTIITWPGVIAAGSISREPIISTDFYPTILEMADLPSQPNQHIDGLSLVPILKKTQDSLKREALLWHYPHYSNQGGTPGGAIRMGDYKLIQFFEDHQVELYNLREDIGETENLAKANPDVTKRLQERLEAWRKSVGAKMPTQNPDFDPAASR